MIMETLKTENNQTETRAGMKNEMEIVFDAVSSNESFARTAVAAFAAHMNPTMEELADIKTAVSEAVTNAIIHGYENFYGYSRHGESQPAYFIIHPGKVKIHCTLENGILTVEITDNGKGIADLDKAMEPLYTTRPELERSGMGFAFMEAFMDELDVKSVVGRGTCVHMKKKLGTGAWIDGEE